MILDIVLYPDKRLETPCGQVEEFGEENLQQLIADMFETMYFHKGAGLAAPQVGVMKQVATIDLSSGKNPSDKIVLVNPAITGVEGSQCCEEGCLSFPGFTEKIIRPMNVFVDARDSAGSAIRLQGSGYLARALQHEIDHLNGIVFIRRMSSLKRELIRRKIRRMLQAGNWGKIRESDMPRI